MSARNSVDKFTDVFLIVCIAIVIGLKITGVITLSWTWLLFPIWGLLVLGVIIMIILVCIAFINAKLENRRNNKNEWN